MQAHEAARPGGAAVGQVLDTAGIPGGTAVKVTTARLPRVAFLKLVREEPTIARGILRGLARIVRDLAPTEV